jgi:hypothetical protein
MNICLICVHRCHNGHKVVPTGYQFLECRCENSLHVCQATQALTVPNHVKYANLKEAQTIPYPSEYELNGHCKVYQNNQYILTSLEITSIQAKLPMCFLATVRESNVIMENNNEETAAYYEVEIISGGFYDQIAIGLTSNDNFPTDVFVGYIPESIGYHGDDGKCFLNGNNFTYGTRFGTKDVIGCGITKSGNIYFVHNGCILPVLDYKMKGNIYPLITLRGEHSCIKIIHDPAQFRFKHKKVANYRNPVTDYNFTHGFSKLIINSDKLIENIHTIALHYRNNNEISKKFKLFGKIVNKLCKKFNKKDILKYLTITEESHTTKISTEQNANNFYANEELHTKNQNFVQGVVQGKRVYDPNAKRPQQDVEKKDNIADITPVRHRGVMNAPNNSNLILSSLQNNSQQSSFYRKNNTTKCHNACGGKCMIF